MEKIIAGNNVEVNEEGYLKNFDEWNEDIAKKIAQEENVDLSERHWDVIKFLQKAHQDDVSLSIRKVGKSGVVDIKEFYKLFPNGPLKVSTKIAGIPKPASCI